jgi:hypothetical protein
MSSRATQKDNGRLDDCDEDEDKDQLEEKQVVKAGGPDEEKTTNLVF